MNLHLILPEAKKDSLSYISENLFLKRIKSYVKTSVLSFKPEKNGGALYKQSKDEQKILKLVPQESRLIVCDEGGCGLDTKNLLKKVENLAEQKTSLAFVIGGPYGLTDQIKEKADLVIKLSDLTMNSDLASAVLWEQLYRIFSLKAGHPYHND